MNPTLRRLLLIICPVAFAITAFVALANRGMPWPALLGCFAFMAALMFAQWFLQTPRQTMRCLAIWLIPVGLIADLQSMWHALAGHPQPSLPIGTLSIAFVFLGLGLAISSFLSSRRAR
jgi:hypothetical protein